MCGEGEYDGISRNVPMIYEVMACQGASAVSNPHTSFKVCLCAPLTTHYPLSLHLSHTMTCSPPPLTTRWDVLCLTVTCHYSSATVPFCYWIGKKWNAPMLLYRACNVKLSDIRGSDTTYITRISALAVETMACVLLSRGQ